MPRFAALAAVAAARVFGAWQARAGVVYRAR